MWLEYLLSGVFLSYRFIDNGYLALLLLLYFIYFLGELAQLARAPALHAGGHRFDSDILHLIHLGLSKKTQEASLGIVVVQIHSLHI